MRFLQIMNTPRGRAVRVIIGAALIVAAVVTGGGWAWLLAAFGALMAATGAAGVCPISPLFGQPARCSVPARRATSA